MPKAPTRTDAAFPLIDGGKARLVRGLGGAVYATPDPEPTGAWVGFFTRRGGVSEAPFDSLNVSTKVGDAPAAVEENLARIRASMDDAPTAWVKQVAGDTVLRVNESGFAGEADALITSREDLALVVAVADCVPVALVGGDTVGMVHSGWRGTLAGVSGKAVRRMSGDGSAEAGIPASEVTAYIGPCIRRCCYEVSEELAAEFARRFGAGVVDGRNLSLPEAIRLDLEQAGVERIVDLELCTGCRPGLFYSHRKQKPHTGRNLAAVVRRGA